jgi:hypothetical protein
MTTKQYIKGNTINRHETEQRIKAIFGLEDVFLVGQGFTPCFTIKHTKGVFHKEATVTEWQIDALRIFNYRVVQLSSSAKGLTVWVSEIMEYE